MKQENNNIETFQILEAEKKTSSVVEEKKLGRIILMFCIANFLINFGVIQVPSFYPGLAADKAHLNYSTIGMCLGSNPFGKIGLSIIIGKMMPVWGRKNSLIISLILQILVQILFGSLAFVTGNKGLFIFLSICARFLQGGIRSVYSSVTYAYVPMFWPNEYQKKLAQMETWNAFDFQINYIFQQSMGILFGAVIGAVLNAIFGYAIPFFMIGASFIFVLIPTIIYIPKDTQKIDKQEKSLPLGKAFTSLKCNVTVIALASQFLAQNFVSPIFINHMSSFGISANISALVYTLPAICYIMTVNLVPKVQKLCLKSFVISLALFIGILSDLFEAPFWGIPKTCISICIGFCLMGVYQSFTNVTVIPQMTEILTPIINDPKIKASDISSSVFMLAQGLAALVGPLMGGSLYDHYGGNVNGYDYPIQERNAFRNCLLILASVQTSCTLLYFIFGDGYKGWLDLFRRCNKEKKQENNSEQPFLEKAQINSSNSSEILENDQQNPQIKINKEK